MVGKTLEDVQADNGRHVSCTLLELVANRIAISITCVKTNAPVKTEGDIDAGLQAYTDLDTINDFEPVALVHLKAYTFS